MCIDLPIISGRKRQQGLTLIELVIFIVLISIGVAGVIGVMRLLARDSANPILMKQQIAIAESLMEEIQSKAFTYCDPNDPEVTTANSTDDCTLAQEMGPPQRDTADNPKKNRYDQTNPFSHVADYNGLNMPASQSIPADGGILDPGDRSIVSGLEKFSARVAIAEAGDSFDITDKKAALRITVTVGAPGQPDLVLTGYRFRYAPNNPN